MTDVIWDIRMNGYNQGKNTYVHCVLVLFYAVNTHRLSLRVNTICKCSL